MPSGVQILLSPDPEVCLLGQKIYLPNSTIRVGRIVNKESSKAKIPTATPTAERYISKLAK